MDHQYEYFVGIDWATERHQVCVIDKEARVVAERQVEHKGESLGALFDELTKLANGRPEHMAVAIETPRGALVESLVERGFHVYAINPKQLDRFRDRHTVAGAKDDRLDAFVLADSVRTDRPCFRRVRVDDPVIVQLRELSRASDGLKVELGRLSNQLREQILRFVPQLLELSPGADEPWLWDLIELVCSTEQPARVRPTQVNRVLKNNRIRRLDADAVLAKLREEAPWTTPGTQQAVRAHIGLLLPRLRVTHQQGRDCERQIEFLLETLAAQPLTEGEIREHRDVRILQSLPGAGKVVVATMLAEASQPLAERDYYTLRSQSGIAPVTKATGKRSKNRATVVMRYGCNGRLRNAFYFWAQAAIKHDDRAKSHYAALRQRGHTHGRSLRGVADRLLSVLIAMLNSCTLYDPGRSAQRLSTVTP
jgi:transposase